MLQGSDLLCAIEHTAKPANHFGGLSSVFWMRYISLADGMRDSISSGVLEAAPGHRYGRQKVLGGNWDRKAESVYCGVRRLRKSGSCAGYSVMAAKSFVMMLLATLVGPAIGVGVFVLMNNF